MRGSLGVAVLVSMLGSLSALAQSNPFAGTWNGTMLEQDSSTCSCTGPGCVTGQQNWT